MSNDSGLFRTAPGPDLLPLYEAKLLHQFDHRWATYDGEAAREGARDVTDAEKADRRFTVTPRYWVARGEVEARLAGRWDREWLIGFRRFGPSTNERSFIANIQPMSGYGDSVFLLFPEDQSAIKSACFLGSLNAMVLDWVVRQKIGGTNINFFYVKQFPVLPPSAYSEDDIDYIVPRVVELVCTADDIAAFGRDVRAEAGEERWKRWQKGRGERGEGRGEREEGRGEREEGRALLSPRSSPLFPFRPERRARLRAELDARFARLYGLSTDELRYVLDPQDVMGADFPGETFRVLKEREMREFGEYRTKRLVMEAWGER